jgi:hypothetical protein
MHSSVRCPLARGDNCTQGRVGIILLSLSFLASSPRRRSSPVPQRLKASFLPRGSRTRMIQCKTFAWQNSWGLSTRTIGVMTMVRGDVLFPRKLRLQFRQAKHEDDTKLFAIELQPSITPSRADGACHFRGVRVHIAQCRKHSWAP